MYPPLLEDVIDVKSLLIIHDLIRSIRPINTPMVANGTDAKVLLELLPDTAVGLICRNKERDQHILIKIRHKSATAPDSRAQNINVTHGLLARDATTDRHGSRSPGSEGREADALESRSSSKMVKIST